MKRSITLLRFLILIILPAIILISCDRNDNNIVISEPKLFDISVTISPSGAGTISPSVDSTYQKDETVNMQAQPNSEYLFTGWSGSVESTENPLPISIDKTYGLTAHFELKSYELTATTEGEGTITERIIPPKASEFEHGTAVELIARPAEGYKFVEWQGDVTGSDNPVQITVDNPKKVTAVFEKKNYALTILYVGAGAVSETVIQQKVNSYEYGTVVELEASPSTGWEFFEWQGALSGSSNPIQITVDSPKEVTVEFELLEEANRPAFYMAENGVTIKCEAASGGDSGTVDGVTYTKRTAADITTTNAATTCTSGITDMSGMFYTYSSFNGDISHWDVSSVTTMEQMFFQAGSFNQDLNGWDVSSVTNMSNMFRSATSFNGNISSWDVSSVIDMSSMFNSANSFNQDIGGWDVSGVENMSYMFDAAISFNQDINSWNISSVTDMTSMFSGAEAFNQDISGWSVGSVMDMDYMFSNATSFNRDISGWETGSVTDMEAMFYGATAFNGDIGNWDVSNVTSMVVMFGEATSFDQDLSGWCVSQIGLEPYDFAVNAGFDPNDGTDDSADADKQPVWGTCPAP